MESQGTIERADIEHVDQEGGKRRPTIADLPPEAIRIWAWYCPDLVGTPVVYFLVDGDECVYVGGTVNVQARIRTHRNEGKKRFNGVWYMPVDGEALAATEVHWITTLKPRYNKSRQGTANAARLHPIEFDERVEQLRRAMQEYPAPCELDRLINTSPNNVREFRAGRIASIRIEWAKTIAAFLHEERKGRKWRPPKWVVIPMDWESKEPARELPLPAKLGVSQRPADSAQAETRRTHTAPKRRNPVTVATERVAGPRGECGQSDNAAALAGSSPLNGSSGQSMRRVDPFSPEAMQLVDDAQFTPQARAVALSLVVAIGWLQDHCAKTGKSIEDVTVEQVINQMVVAHMTGVVG